MAVGDDGGGWWRFGDDGGGLVTTVATMAVKQHKFFIDFIKKNGTTGGERAGSMTEEGRLELYEGRKEGETERKRQIKRWFY
ncbi:hypothetical protein L484_004522 [Morus notabilis]|uniref:Uncharacterized protein n=1 Tax=Morus notabilis TaxID=981085 RepID=W9QS10_9ROSA|nr:hypothetical protein L484_004522 [Morus notabilis]